jgi:hypothetical protein
MRCKVVVAVVLATLVQGPPGVAYADTSHNNSWTGATYCVNETSLVADDSKGNGSSKGTVRSYKDTGCSKAVNRDVQYLAQWLLVWYRKPGGKDQRLCTYTPEYYNTKPAWALSVSLQYPEVPYCGAGWYETEAFGFLRYGGKWRGGSVNSGEQYLNN